MTREDFMKMVNDNIEVIEGVQAEACFYEEKITDLILSSDDVFGMPFQANKTTIKKVSVSGLSFDDTYFKNDIIEDVIIKNVNFSDSKVYDSGFYNVTFEGVTFDRYITINKSLFDGCTFINCVFDEVDMMDDAFEDCVFKNCSFVACDLEDSYFKKTEITETVFNQCKHLEFTDDFVFTVTTK